MMRIGRAVAVWSVVALAVVGCRSSESSTSAPRAYSSPTNAANWKPVAGGLMTRWAKDVDPANPLPEYPRPQMARGQWMSLNGVWEMAEAKQGDAAPVGKKLSGEILVPFPVESALSGVKKQVQRLDYRRTFTVPAQWSGKRVVLNFGAVDWESTVYVNGKELGTHRGGYDPFSFDITDALKPSGEQEIVVRVFDPGDDGDQPRGKQVNKPRGIFYTPCTGIWQTVWLEPVAASHIADLKIVPDVDAGTVTVTAKATGAGPVTVVARAGKTEVARGKGAAGEPITLKIAKPKLWSPEEPFLYDLSVSTDSDSVGSYFGMRKIALGKDEKGITRMMFNGKPVFHMGPLDQGFWPDGIYTAPTDAALKYDIEVTKKLGFNAIRKHVKVEPARWYYWADKLGVIVWQDMPHGNNRTDESKKQFEHELRRMIETHWNIPSIVMWVPFNEGWGQYDSEGCARVVADVKKLDPTRLVNEASGWNNYGHGDVSDMHKYPTPGMNPVEPNRASVLGEYGGLGLFVKGHTWSEQQFSYQGMETPEDLTRNYTRFMGRVWELRDHGLCAAIYTQTTDVETEMNGLLTYDREVIKVDVDKVRRANQGDAPHVEQQVIVPTAREQQNKIQWRYTKEKPADNWSAESFDDSSWKRGASGFGSDGTPGAVIGTQWTSDDIWIRREFELNEAPSSDMLILFHHDDDAEVYINGKLATRGRQATAEYQETRIRPEALQALRKGKNTFAVHCKNTGGKQFIDVGIVRLVERPRR